jgi:hypothetical protein
MMADDRSHRGRGGATGAVVGCNTQLSPAPAVFSFMRSMADEGLNHNSRDAGTV